MRLHRLSALILVAIVGWSAPAIAGQAGEPEYFLLDVQCTGGKFGMTLPATLPKLLALAPVRQRKVLEVEHWEGYDATRERVDFDGLTLDLITYSNDPGRYSLASAVIRARAWTKIAPFAVGEAVESVRRKLGQAAAVDETLRSTYSGEADSLRFETRSGKVTAVIYACYTG